MASWFLHEDSRFWMRFIPKFERGHPERGRFMTGVGTNWRLWTCKATFFSKRCKIGPLLLLITNSKMYMRFRLVPLSSTLDDLELTCNGHCALCYITHVFWGPPHAQNWMKIHSYYVSGKNVSRDLSFYQDKVFVDICGGSLKRGR